MNKHTYVELNFDQESKDYFSSIVKEMVHEDELYFSDEVERIRGDVTGKLHLTLFYGLDAEEVNNPELKKFVDEINLKDLNLKFGYFRLFRGYQDMYKVLNIEVLDEDKKLLEIYNGLKLFKADEEYVQREFKPHLTLAYVQPDYRFPYKFPRIDKEIIPENIEIKVEK